MDGVTRRERGGWGDRKREVDGVTGRERWMG